MEREREGGCNQMIAVDMFAERNLVAPETRYLLHRYSEPDSVIRTTCYCDNLLRLQPLIPE